MGTGIGSALLFEVKFSKAQRGNAMEMASLLAQKTAGLRDNSSAEKES